MVTRERPQRIAIADDSSAFLSAASTYVASLPGCELAGTAPNVNAALALVEAVSPDVLLLDLGAVPSRGLEMVRRVRSAPRPPTIIALALFHTQEGAAQARSAGAEALVGKDAFVSGLHEVLVRIKSGTGAA
jgi:DNA-binding NarL/FixJ family response regulator